MSGQDPAPRLAAVDYDPFAGAALSLAVALTPAQREIWLACRLGRDASLAFNEAIELHVRGALQVDALRAAIAALVARHECLRATFAEDGRHMLVEETGSPQWRSSDMRGLAAPERDARLAAARRDAVGQPFDLAAGPLLRLHLLQAAEDEHHLVLAAHHIVCDGWSFGVLVRELSALYRAALEGRPDPLPAADSFARFAQRQAAADVGDARDYWLARYATVPPPLDLPCDRTRPPLRDVASARIDVELPAEEVLPLRDFARGQRSSLFAVLLAGFGLLLRRLTGQDDVAIGVPAAGQAAVGARALLGHGVNLLPLRLAVADDATAASLVARARAALLDGIEQQWLGFGELLSQLPLARDPARLPLLSVMFNLDQAVPDADLDFGAAQATLASLPRTCENFELFVNAVQHGDGLRLECQYSTALFDAASVALWLDCYRLLLAGLVRAGDAPLVTLPMVPAADQARQAGWNATAAAFRDGCGVQDLVWQRAAATPTAIAVADDRGALDYAGLRRRAGAIAATLRARGVGRGDRVGVAMERGTDLVATLLGIWQAGASYVPLDPSFPALRLTFMAQDAGLRLLAVDRAPPQALADWPPERWLPVADLADADTGGDLDAGGGAGPDDEAYVIYTSGSTGQPKGVRIGHRAVANFLDSMIRTPGLAPGDRLLAITTLSFDISVLELFGPLVAGGRTVLLPRGHTEDGDGLARQLQRFGITVLQATPSTWQLLAASGWRSAPGFTALCGGEPLPPALAGTLLAGGGRLWNLYGPTETTVWSSADEVRDGADIRIGRPIANTRIAVIDGQGLPCPTGVWGELWIAGAGVALGYLDRPELTGERFVAEPQGGRTGARAYRTGDRGRWRHDGRLEHGGRLDHQVKLRGHRIELGEIEAALASHPQVREAAVAVHTVRAGDQRLVACVVGGGAGAPDEAALREHLRERVPAYMVPQHFLPLADLPRLPNGKLDRSRLPAPNAAAPPRAAPPADDLERQVAAIMESVLSLPGLCRDDDFFRLGGHSLLAAELVARLGTAFGQQLPLAAVFQAPTVARLAERIRHGRDRGAATIERRADRRHAPLSLMQQRVWYLEQLHPGRVVYNTPSAHRLRGPLDAGAFERALAAIVERQPALRTTIGQDGDLPVQTIMDALPGPVLAHEDLGRHPPAEREAQLHERLQALANEPFDLDGAPLFRARLFRLADDEHVLFFMAHHLVWDGWSFDLLYRELALHYAAAKAGAPAPLPALAIDYGDFCQWQLERLDGDDLADQVEHWRARLADLPPPLQLPGDRPRPARMSGEGSTRWLQLPAVPTARLRQLGQAADGTLFMVLLAAYAALLHRLGGSDDLVIGTPVRGRQQPALEAVMGFFVNALPLRLRIDGGGSFRDLVGTVRSAVQDAFAAPDVPIERLVRALDLRRDERHPPLYQAFFSYQDGRQRISRWGDLAHEPIFLFQRGVSEDIGLWFLETGSGLTGGMTYNTDVFNAATVDGFCATLQALLEQAAAQPDLPLRALVPGAGSAAIAAPPAPAAGEPIAATGAAARPAAGPAAPVTPAERYLVQLFEELIGVDDVVPGDNFFDRGGHSLLALTLVSRVQRATGVRLGLLAIAGSSLRALATELPERIDPDAAAPQGLGARLRRLLGGTGRGGR